MQLKLFGRLVDTDPDVLPAFRVDVVAITDPEVVATSGLSEHSILHRTGDLADVIEGAVLRLTPDELAAADAYEVNDYQRIEVSLRSGRRAWVYVAAADGNDPSAPPRVDPDQGF